MKYASSNFSLYLYQKNHILSHFPLFSKLLRGKGYAKAEYMKSENSLKNQEHFIIINAQQTFVLMKTSWRRLEDIFCLRLQKTSSRRLDQDKHIRYTHTSSEDILKTSWSKPLYSSSSYVFKMFSRRLQDVFKTSSRCLRDVLKMSLRRLAKMSSRCFQNVSSSYTVLVNKFSRSLQGVFPTFLKCSA